MCSKGCIKNIPVHPQDSSLKYPFNYLELQSPEQMVRNLSEEYVSGKFKIDPQTGMFLRGWQYNAVDAISDHFMEDIRINCHQRGKLNLVDIWERTPVSILKKFKTPDETRLFLMKEGRECRPFATALGIHFYLDYLPGPIKVLDPSSGWGDRMIAAIVAGDRVVEYHGYDPEKTLVPRYHAIMERLDTSKKCTISTEPFQLAQIPKGYYDIAVTSPPYFNLEDYSKAEDQSIVMYPDYDTWLKKFYIPYLLNMRYGVRKGGLIMIYVSDYTGMDGNGKKKVFDLEKQTVEILTKRATGVTLLLKGGLQTKPNDSSRPFFVFNVNE